MKHYDCKFCSHFYAIGKCELKKKVNCYNDNWKTGLCESDYYETTCECEDYKMNCHGKTGLYLLYREYIKRDEPIIAYKTFNKVIIDEKERFYDKEYNNIFYYSNEEYKPQKTFYCKEEAEANSSKVKIWGEIKREDGKIKAEYFTIEETK